MLVIHGERQADIFLAGLTTNGTEESRTDFQLVGHGDSCGVHIHSGVVTTKFSEPVVLLVLMRGVDCFSVQCTGSHSKSED